jgi:hypothetical protein
MLQLLDIWLLANRNDSTATAVAGYTGCAGVKRDVQSCENYVTAAEITCVDACPADKNGKTNAACVAAW